MPRSDQKKQKQKQRKLRQRKAKERKKVMRAADAVVPEASAKVARKIEEIYGWLDEGEVEYGFDLLRTLVKSSPKCAAVAEAEHGIYSHVGDAGKACLAAKRLCRLLPQNPDAVTNYAQDSLFCSRVSIALVQYRKFLDRWPTHEYATKIKNAIEVCEPESRNRVAVANESGGLELAFDEGGLEFYARHEESLEQLAASNFAEAIVLLEQNLEEQPKFMSSRNNLVICYFYIGEFEKAVATARETCRLAPENRFAQANLIKFEFLTGNSQTANELADLMVADPPTQQDPFTAMVEALGFLGRDEDIIVVSQILDQVTPIDDDKLGLVLHQFAVANYRLDDRTEASRLWDQCLETFPNQFEAQRNVRDVETNGGHAAWGEPITKWLPQPFVEEMLRKCDEVSQSEEGFLAIQSPVIAALVPALLDRGDPQGRELAVAVAGNAATPPMLDALKVFAFSSRGPDELRYQALNKLREESVVDAGPHRFFSQGKWTQVQLCCAEITEEPDQVEPWRKKLLEEGYHAINRGDFEIAETAFKKVFERDPECRIARFNLASVWLQRRDGDEEDKATQEVLKIHAEHPDYTFAAMTVAMYKAEDGEFDRANELLKEVYELPRLHSSEALSLFSTQVQVSLMQGDLKTAESAMFMLKQLVDEGHPVVPDLQQMIDRYILENANDKKHLSNLRSAFNLF